MKRFWACESFRAWEQEIPSTSRHTTYTLSWGPLEGRAIQYQGGKWGYRCTCPGYVNWHRCKHTRQAAQSGLLRCGWHNITSGEQPEQTPEGPRCPCCKEAVFETFLWSAA
jgi:hypothetical protein